MTDFLKKHRNALLLTLLTVTLAVSWFFNRQRLTEAAATVSLPVTQVTGAPVSRLDAYRAQRDEQALTDMAALQALCDQDALDAQTRQAAADQLREMVARRESQIALEGALVESGVYPCVAVLSPGSVTIVTEKADLTGGESALVLTLAKAHAGVEPSGVRVMTAQDAP